MSFNKILELADKFAAVDEPANQQQKIELFYHDFTRKFRTILNEMEGDIFTLKEKRIDRNVLQEFAVLWKGLLEIYKNVDEDNPYRSAARLVNMVETLDTKNKIVKLEQLIDSHLARTKVVIDTTLVQNSRVDSLKELLEFAKYLHYYMKNNPINDNHSKLSDSGTYPPSQINREDLTRS